LAVLDKKGLIKKKVIACNNDFDEKKLLIFINEKYPGQIKQHA